jgi:hypothetical protein
MAKNTEQPVGWNNIGFSKTPQWHNDCEKVNLSEVAKDKYVQVRLVTLPLQEVKHWVFRDVKHFIGTTQGKTYGMKEAPSFPVTCPDCNPRTGMITPKKCPVCTLFSPLGQQKTFWAWAYIGIPKARAHFNYYIIRG